MSDLPDYQRNIQIVAGEADVAEYDSDPGDITDGERGPILIDIKGRVYNLADLIKIDGVAVASDGEGRQDVRADLIKSRGVAFPSTTQAGTLPMEIRHSTIAYNACDDLFQVSARQLYGSLGHLLQQKASTYELKTYDSFLEALLGGGLPAALDAGALKIKEQSPLAAIKLWDGTNYLATPGVGDAIARGVFLFGSDYGSPTPAAQIVKVDSSGRLSCTLG